MSYGRNPYYIWSNGKQLYLNGIYVNEKIINAFLYKVLLLNRREELAQRLREGKKEWESKTEIKGFEEIFNNMDTTLINLPQSKEVMDWFNEQEDDVIKKLMSR